MVRRYRLQAISLILMWIGALEVAASFVVRYWFQFDVHFTPVFFLLLLLGIVMYVLTRIL